MTLPPRDRRRGARWIGEDNPSVLIARRVNNWSRRIPKDMVYSTLIDVLYRHVYLVMTLTDRSGERANRGADKQSRTYLRGKIPGKRKKPWTARSPIISR